MCPDQPPHIWFLLKLDPIPTLLKKKKYMQKEATLAWMNTKAAFIDILATGGQQKTLKLRGVCLQASSVESAPLSGQEMYVHLF